MPLICNSRPGWLAPACGSDGLKQRALCKQGLREEEGRPESMLGFTQVCLPALSGEAFQEKGAREGFCVSDS